MGIAVTEFTPVEQTAFLTQYARALDSRWARPILGDGLADEIVARIDYDFPGLGVPTSVVCQTALRAKMLDDRDFTSEYPNAVVVDLGAGLDTGMQRVNPPATVDWYNVDLPNVIALRDELVSAAEHAYSVPASLADDARTGTIPAGWPTVLIADGLLAFLSEDVIIRLFRHITDHFGELTFNDYGRIGWFSRVAVRLAPQKMFSTVGSQWGYPGFKDVHHPETWNPRLTLVEEASLAHAPEVALFPIRVLTRLMGMTKAGARKARILRYRF